MVKLSLNWLLAGAVESLQGWEEGSPCPEMLAAELLAGKLSWLNLCCLPAEPDCDAGRTV